MNRPLLTIACFIAVAAGSLFLAAEDATAQDSVSIYVYYVKRSATHIGSGYSYTQSYGPYDTMAEAEAMRAQLNQNRYSSSYGYGEAYIESGINPMFQRMVFYDVSWTYQWLTIR